MKFLNIIRHSESETNSKDDFLRTLNDEGIKDAINLDNYLIQHNFKKHKIICSTSKRTRETLGYLQNSLNPESKVIFSQDAYLGTFKKLLKEITLEAKNTRTITLIGHNPGLSDLLSYLIGNYDMRDMGTTSIASLSFYNQGQDITYEGTAKLDFFVQSKNNIIIDL